MITYEEALEKARSIKKVDYSIEYDTAYLFESYEEEGAIGGHPVIIIKYNGNIIEPEEFFNDFAIRVIKRIDLHEEEKQAEIREKQAKAQEEFKTKVSNAEITFKKVWPFIEVFIAFIIINFNALIAALLGLIPIPALGVILLIPFIIVMIVLLGLLTRKLRAAFSQFFALIIILVGAFDVTFKTFLDILSKVFVGFGSVVCFIGFAVSTLIIGWGTYLAMRFLIKNDND